MQLRLPSSERLSPSAVVGAAALVAAVAGVAWWSYWLTAPLSQPAAPAAIVARDGDNAVRDITRWLSPGPAKVDVKVTGVLAAGSHGGAVLSLNGGPPRAYAIGESLAPSVALFGIDADAVILDHGGKRIRLPLPALQNLPEDGLARVQPH